MVPNLWHIPDKESGTWTMLVARPIWLIDKILQHPGIVKKTLNKILIYIYIYTYVYIYICTYICLYICKKTNQLVQEFGFLQFYLLSLEATRNETMPRQIFAKVMWCPQCLHECGSNVWRSENMEQMRWNMADKTQVKHWWLWNMKKTYEHMLKCQHFVSPMSFCLETRLIFFHLLLSYLPSLWLVYEIRIDLPFTFQADFFLNLSTQHKSGLKIISYSKLGGSVEHS